MEQVSSKGREYLKEMPKEQWQGTAWIENPSLPPRFGIVTTNMSKSANSMLEKERNGSWLDCIDQILSIMLERICALRQKHRDRSGVVDEMRGILERRWNNCADFQVWELLENGGIFRVCRNSRGSTEPERSYVLNIREQTCECGKWQDHEVPCIDAIAYYKMIEKQTLQYIIDNHRTADYVINHIAKEFEYGLDIASALKELQPADKTSWEPKLKYSTATDADQKEAENRQHTMMYQSQLNAYIKRSEMYTANLVKAYALLWERCSQGLKNKIESRRDYAKIMNDPIALLKAIREHALNFQDDKFCMTIIIEALLTLVHTKQKEGESLQDYTRRFRIALEI
ncbi:hypothetical protein IV203_026478 [Nitzschia inconspicua]|uniref:SWIM-type domain-containing protein n=1 Tax=Nitzschia inconspicua TaxID=303405 RepID=A0A9K3PX98_9STRA|nr:hypothetical protein IV203_026478 [Nitzschia inconspicua]